MYRNLTYRYHAMQRMLERDISESEVAQVLEGCEVVEDYADDKPYPSKLVLGYAGARSLHVVCADNDEAALTYVITIYEPDLSEWEADLKTRK